MRRPKLLNSGWIGPAFFFGALLILGLSIARDYGLNIDELTNHWFGVRWYHYAEDIVVHHAPIGPMAKAGEHDVIHGPLFEMTLAWIEEAVLHLDSLRQALFFRHYATWLTFYFGVIGVYFLARKLWGSRPLALLACLFLVMQPRIFAHAFNDSVDIPFLVFYTASIYTLIRYLDRRTFGAACLHAFTCAVAVDIRLTGGIIPALTLAAIVLDLIVRREPERKILPELGRVAVFLFVGAVATLLLWPYLWNQPWERGLEVIRQTPRINWNGLVLYCGREIRATQLPWHYIPVWILITTPVAFSGFFLIGLGELLIAVARHPVRCCRERRNDLVIAAAFLMPLGAVILLRAVVYDAWRHLFFVYPAFVLISVAGVRHAMKWVEAKLPERVAAWAKGLGGAVIALNVAVVAWTMVAYHPYENVYFNRLAGPSLPEIKRRFELDYWGVSYRRGLEYIMRHDPRNTVKIERGENDLTAITRWFLPAADNRRIRETNFDDAEYVLTIFRKSREGYPKLTKYYAVTVDGAEILCVYRKQPKAK